MDNKKVKDFLSLYLADCDLEHLEYNDDTYKIAKTLASQLDMPEGQPAASK